MGWSRRGFVTGFAGLGASQAAAAPVAGRVPARPALDPAALAQDEAYWSQIAALYDVSEAVTNLEAGYWGVMTRPVKTAFLANIDRMNREGSYYVRRELGGDMAAVYDRLAGFLGVRADELLLVRSATEALQILIGGYNKLQPGDAVLYADLDYSSMKTAMAWLNTRRGVETIKISLPEPASREAFIQAYAEALDAHPHIRMMLLTHVNNITGLVHPIDEITAVAEARGVDVILDSAHAVGQLDFNFAGLRAPFIGMNLHKWIGAPLGCGLIYVRKDRIADIDPFMGEPGDADDLRIRAHTGALNFAAPLTIPAALDVHEAIGAGAKQARLRYLRDVWVNEARGLPGLDILTPDDPELVAGMTAFRFRDRPTTADNNALVAQLSEVHRIFTVRRTGPAAGDCVRVTPALYNTPADMARLAPALRALA
ncbi:MAG: aminotransferase class V-fold PLP-dependent enzyme [Maricaulaceae bacterium]